MEAASGITGSLIVAQKTSERTLQNVFGVVLAFAESFDLTVVITSDELIEILEHGRTENSGCVVTGVFNQDVEEVDYFNSTIFLICVKLLPVMEQK